MAFEETLTAALAGARKVVIVGIGNELNGDDGFGVHVAQTLGNFGKVISIAAHTVPENFISKIASERPSHVLFIDTAVLDFDPGTLRILETSDLARVKTVTHHIPLSTLVDRLRGMHDCRILIIGMQPGNMDVGAGLSEEANAAAIELMQLLRNNLS